MRIATWNVNSLAVRLPQVLDWLGALQSWIADELVRHPALVLMGDFNIAP